MNEKELKDNILKIIDRHLEADINRRVNEYRMQLEEFRSNIMRSFNFRVRVSCDMDYETMEQIITAYCDEMLKIPELKWQ